MSWAGNRGNTSYAFLAACGAGVCAAFYVLQLLLLFQGMCPQILKALLCQKQTKYNSSYPHLGVTQLMCTGKTYVKCTGPD